MRYPPHPSALWAEQLQVINSSGVKGDVAHVGTPLGYFPQSISFINNVSLRGKSYLAFIRFCTCLA